MASLSGNAEPATEAKGGTKPLNEINGGLAMHRLTLIVGNVLSVNGHHRSLTRAISDKEAPLWYEPVPSDPLPEMPDVSGESQI